MSPSGDRSIQRRPTQSLLHRWFDSIPPVSLPFLRCFLSLARSSRPPRHLIIRRTPEGNSKAPKNPAHLARRSGGLFCTAQHCTASALPFAVVLVVVVVNANPHYATSHQQKHPFAAFPSLLSSIIFLAVSPRPVTFKRHPRNALLTPHLFQERTTLI